MIEMLLSMMLFAPPAKAVTDVNWMAGCWTYTSGGRTVREQWIPPDGGTMLGVSRTVAGGKTVEYEFLMIREGANGLEYVARPSGQAEAVFTATESGGGHEIAFTNPKHDFPTSIRYRREGDRLTATIEGTMDGKPRAFAVAYAACAR